MSSENFTHIKSGVTENVEYQMEAARDCAAVEDALRKKSIDWIQSWIERAYRYGDQDQEKKQQWQHIVGHLPGIPLRFLEQSLRTTTDADLLCATTDDIEYWVRGELERLRIQLQRSGFTSVRGSFPIAKTGSRLEAKVFGRKTVLINTVSREARNAWISAASIVPVSPIFRELPEDQSQVRVVTRYCGSSIGDILDITAELLKGYKKDIVEREVRDFVREIDAQKVSIAKRLYEAGISHGHMHHGNFTVEFIRRTYLASTTGHNIEKADGAWRLPSGQALNRVPYNDADFAFRLSRYFDEPGEWVPVVRLIDFDMALVHSPRLSFDQWLAKDTHGAKEWRMEDLLKPRGRARLMDAWRGAVRKIATSITFGKAADGGLRMTVEQAERRAGELERRGRKGH